MKIATSLIILLIVVIFPISIAAQLNTAFNFQGRLNDGSSPANGWYDHRFRLFNAPTGASNFRR